MKFTPREFTDNVNVPKTNPVAEFFILAGGILGSAVILYFILGFFLDLAIDANAKPFEDMLARPFSVHLEKCGSAEENLKAQQEQIQKIFDRLVSYSTLRQYKFRVHIIKDEEPNAISLPGHNIVIMTGLLKELKSENELTMILGHELGHYAHHDHLKGLGNGLLLLTLTAIFTGSDAGLSSSAQGVLRLAGLKHSRAQETAADLYGLDLLNLYYGHVGGASQFFETMAAKGGLRRWLGYLSTHPRDAQRIKNVQESIRARRYKIESTQALALANEQLAPKIENLEEK